MPLPPAPTRPMTRGQVAEFYRCLADVMPDPRTELAYRTPFELLLAVVLSAQTTDAAVNRATPALFAAAQDAAAMAALGEAGIGPYIRTLGLWQAKSRHVAALAGILVERHGGGVPSERAALEALPGVGRKTANVVLNVVFGQPTLAVDTHVFRLGNRTGLAPGKTPRDVEDALLRRTPVDQLMLAHHRLILHGRHVCKARAPECWRCAAFTPCRYRMKAARVIPPPAARPLRSPAPD